MNHRNAAILIPLAILTVFLLPSRAAAAGGWAERSFTVPAHLEREPVPSSLLLTVEWMDYGRIDLEALAARKSDAPEKAFTDLMASLRQKSYDRAGRYLIGKEATGEGDLKQKMDLYHQAFGGFEQVSVLGRARLGSREVFFWQVPTPRGPFVRAWALEATEGGYLGELISSLQPVEELVMHAVERASSDPASYRGAAGAEPRHAYRLPMAGPAPQSPVILRFDGELVDVSVFSDPVEVGNEVVEFYRQSWKLFKDRELEAFLDRYTPGSREKLASWFAGMASEEFESYYLTVLSGRRLWFVLDAAPFYLVLYTEGPQADSEDSLLRYDYVLRSPETGGLQLTNAYFQSFLDDVLGNPELFARTPRDLKEKVLGLNPGK